MSADAARPAALTDEVTVGKMRLADAATVAEAAAPTAIAGLCENVETEPTAGSSSASGGGGGGGSGTCAIGASSS